MRSVLKWIGIGLLALVGIIIVSGVVGFFSSESRINQPYETAAKSLDIPTDAAAIAEGHRLADIRGCTGCHGPDLGGDSFIDDAAFAVINAPNLTTGVGGVTADFTAADWDRAIRHGVGPDGMSLLIMPSYDLSGVSDEDISRIIAYARSVPPVDREFGADKIGPVARVLLLANQLPLLSAELVDPNVVAPVAVTPEVSAEFGHYIATTCVGCHGPDFSGGAVPGSAADEPPAANLTPAGELGHWTFEDFNTTLTTGVTPDGKVLDPAFMPWPIVVEMTPVEREALWTYLSGLPPVITN